MIYSLSPGSTEFSEMDRALATEEFTWQDRSAMCQDGSETGMTSLVIILNNLKGIFTITNRTFDLSAMNKAGLEGLLSNIDLVKIE